MISVFQKLPRQDEVLKIPYWHTLQGKIKQENLLIFDDNLNAMRYLLQKTYRNKLDLVYMDPPFGTNNIFKLGSTMSAARNAKIAYKDEFGLESYLKFLYPRLVLIREIMSEEVSLYLHIDTKMGHYVKILCDEVFGREFFMNDITRVKYNPKNFFKKSYGNVKYDFILCQKRQVYLE